MNDPFVHSPARILAQWIETSGLGSDPEGVGDWPCFVNHLPPPDDVATEAIMISDTSGTIVSRLMRNGEVFQNFGVQVWIRSDDQNTGFQKAVAIGVALDTVLRSEIDVEGVTYLLHNALVNSGVLPVGQDEDRKYGTALNYSLILTKEVEK
jgi:hypothetical protein